ncbi:glycosyltransferase family 4 protein [Candidatus Bathyarchaeota archaeon]|nr:glycosyltransferase family 4 protein [Candidatus Bathyarchaeota archaeon]
MIVHPGIYMYGGAELVIVRLSNYMTKKGIENALLTTCILPEMEKDLNGTKIIIQKKRKYPLDKITGFGELIALNRGTTSMLNSFDVINVHNCPAEFSTFPHHRSTIWMCNEPLLNLLLEQKSTQIPKLIKKLILFFSRFVAKSFLRHAVVADEFNAKRFQNIYGFKPKIIPYGIDYDFFSKSNGRKGLAKFDLYDNFVVLQVGPLNQFKNQIESIRTIEKLRSKIPKIKLLLVGRGESEKPALQRYVRDRGLEKHVIFTEHLDRDLVRELYHACHVLLHPIKPAGGWLAPFEALSASKPIVVSAQTTTSEIIRNEGIGVVTNDFPSVIWNIYKNPDKYLKIAKKGKAWVKKNLSWERFCERMVNLFYDTLEENR